MKAIETVFDGYRFRSRLEARWAVFFKTLGIEYQYEVEGFDLDGVRYLPDFWLPEQDCWIEIKGKEPTDSEKQKVQKLAHLTSKISLLFYGEIGPFEWTTDDKTHGSAYPFIPATGDDVYIGSEKPSFGWTECRDCGAVVIAFSGVAGMGWLRPKMQVSTMNDCHCASSGSTKMLPVGTHTPRLIAAYTAARQARFEFGR